MTGSLLDEFLARLRGAESVTCCCAFCSWETRGSLEETREAFAEHVCPRPKPTTTVRRKSGFSRVAR